MEKMRKFMLELVVNRGVPGSGKSTGAIAWVNARPNRVRSNRDDIRKAGYGTFFGPPVDEDVVTKIQHAGIRAALSAGVSVVVDDCNIEAKYIKQLANIGYEYDADVRIELYDVPLSVALERNSGRERVVPEEVIRRMHSRLQGLKDVQLPERLVIRKIDDPERRDKVIMVDIDGTIAKMHNRGPFEWHKVGNDLPMNHVIDLLRAYDNMGYIIILMSGRDSVCREKTIQWLNDNEVPYDYLYMRPEGDVRKDSIVKHELYWNHVGENFTPDFVLDDRNQVVEMWRAMGLICFQVAEGNF